MFDYLGSVWVGCVCMFAYLCLYAGTKCMYISSFPLFVSIWLQVAAEHVCVDLNVAFVSFVSAFSTE